MAGIRTYNQIYEDMRNFFIANQDVVTDLNSEGGLDTMLRAFAQEMAQGYTKVSGGFKKQFDAIPFQFFDFDRRQAMKASSTVVISRSVAAATVITIPSGTIVSSPSGNLYITQEAGEISSGNTNSGAINVQAEKVGSSYNGQIGSISVINSTVDGANTVTNNIAISGGRDKETNAEYFARFTEYILGLAKSNPYGIKSIAAGISGVQSVYIENHFPPISGYNYTVYIDDGSGASPQSLLDDVLLAIVGNDTEDYQGANSAGINVRVLGASLVNLAFVMQLDADPVLGDEDLISSQVESVLVDYMNSLNIGQDVLYSEISRIIKSIDNVYDINTLTLNGGTSNISVAVNQIARAGSVTVTFSSSHPR